jgi:hypothetical protein
MPVDLWVDVLCIDQNNDVEKGEQVARVHKIYGRADQTIIWSGSAGDGSDMAVRALRETRKEATLVGIMNLNEGPF